jgi:PAS domain S-box-containing protein
MFLAHREAAPGPTVSAAPHASRLLWLASLLVKRRAPLACAAWLVSALAVATLLRMAAGIITSGVPLVFYLPAVSIVALFTGWECGVAAVLLSTVLAWVLFVPPVLTLHPPNLQQALALLFWMLIGGTQVVIAYFLRLGLQAALQSETRYRKLLDVTSGSIWTIDEAGEIHAPQTGWTELTGMPWPEYRGRGWLKTVHPEDQDRLMLAQNPGVNDFGEAELRLWNAGRVDWRWFLARSVAVPHLSGQGHERIIAVHDIHEHKLANDRRDIVIGELRHRLKNLLTIIDALAKNSRSRMESEKEVEAFLKRFLGRLHALGAAADLVLAGRRVAIECGALVRATLSPFMEDKRSRFQLSGTELQLSEETGGTLGLALHEMATNALKYGALSSEGGTVSVRWSASPAEGGHEQVVIEWKERGGPPPVPPNKEGFGTRLIRSVPARERNGEVEINYEPDGFFCRIAFLRPADWFAVGDEDREAAE